MVRVLVTAGSSYLGKHLLPLIPPKFDAYYTFYSHNPLDLPNGHQLDLRDKTAVSQLLQKIQPHVIVHLAGSNRPNDMASIIRDGTFHMVAGAIQCGARLIHLSTDSIFNGLDAPYDETAVPSPVNEYGRAKVDAETAVKTHTNFAIVRTSLIYSLEEMDHSTKWMSQSLNNNQPITLFANQVRNPVFIESLSHACIELISHEFCGILNVVGNQVLTRAAFAIKMFDYWQISNRKLVTIKNSSKKHWPLNCQLDNSLAKSMLKTHLWGVDEAFANR